MQHFPFLLTSIYFAAMIALFALAIQTSKDDGSRVYRRETISMCATGVFLLGVASSKLNDIRDLLYVIGPSVIFAAIGVRLFLSGRRASVKSGSK